VLAKSAVMNCPDIDLMAFPLAIELAISRNHPVRRRAQRCSWRDRHKKIVGLESVTPADRDPLPISAITETSAYPVSKGSLESRLHDLAAPQKRCQTEP